MTKLLRLLLAILFIASGILVFSTLFPDFQLFPITHEQFWTGKAQDIEYHKKLWSQQRITKYKIGVHFSTAFLSYPGSTTFECSQELVVDNNKIVQMILSTCDQASFFTIDNLFSRIEEKVKSRQCDPEGCKCGPLVVDVVYDSQYFFPKKAKTFYDWKAGRTFFMRPGENFCMGVGGNATQGIELEIYSFVPMQQEP